jgi:hypothetical protein
VTWGWIRSYRARARGKNRWAENPTDRSHPHVRQPRTCSWAVAGGVAGGDPPAEPGPVRTVDWGAMMFLEGADASQAASRRFSQAVLLLVRGGDRRAAGRGARPAGVEGGSPRPGGRRGTVAILLDCSPSMGFARTGHRGRSWRRRRPSSCSSCTAGTGCRWCWPAARSRRPTGPDGRPVGRRPADRVGRTGARPGDSPGRWRTRWTRSSGTPRPRRRRGGRGRAALRQTRRRRRSSSSRSTSCPTGRRPTGGRCSTRRRVGRRLAAAAGPGNLVARVVWVPVGSPEGGNLAVRSVEVTNGPARRRPAGEVEVGCRTTGRSSGRRPADDPGRVAVVSTSG